MATSSNVRLGFMFCDGSFFNAVVSTDQWKDLQCMQDADFHLQKFAGELACKLAINVTDPYLKEVQEGGIETNLCSDGQLFHLVEEKPDSPPVLSESDSPQSVTGSSQGNKI
ncbi:hypothetical protein ElyMa_002620300 [Elysia marginata]|uniref:Uncharacterized protein n=1 Tax=Elysia marginata TaxID=1093978 RepID=A0AAV4H2V0_9GAST|nr:hypothetical protein ElyMa_002620300 [Elysia marginata]